MRVELLLIAVVGVVEGTFSGAYCPLNGGLTVLQTPSFESPITVGINRGRSIVTGMVLTGMNGNRVSVWLGGIFVGNVDVIRNFMVVYFEDEFETQNVSRNTIGELVQQKGSNASAVTTMDGVGPAYVSNVTIYYWGGAHGFGDYVPFSNGGIAWLMTPCVWLDMLNYQGGLAVTNAAMSFNNVGIGAGYCDNTPAEFRGRTIGGLTGTDFTTANGAAVAVANSWTVCYDYGNVLQTIAGNAVRTHAVTGPYEAYKVMPCNDWNARFGSIGFTISGPGEGNGIAIGMTVCGTNPQILGGQTGYNAPINGEAYNTNGYLLNQKGWPGIQYDLTWDAVNLSRFYRESSNVGARIETLWGTSAVGGAPWSWLEPNCATNSGGQEGAHSLQFGYSGRWVNTPPKEICYGIPNNFLTSVPTGHNFWVRVNNVKQYSAHPDLVNEGGGFQAYTYTPTSGVWTGRGVTFVNPGSVVIGVLMERYIPPGTVPLGYGISGFQNTNAPYEFATISDTLVGVRVIGGQIDCSGRLGVVVIAPWCYKCNVLFGEYMDVINQVGLCKQMRICNVSSEYEAVGGTYTSNRVCAANVTTTPTMTAQCNSIACAACNIGVGCSVCIDGYYVNVSSGWCVVQRAVCDVVGQYESVAATGTSSRVCVNCSSGCSVCTNGVSCDCMTLYYNVSSGGCTRYSNCPGGTYVTGGTSGNYTCGGCSPGLWSNTQNAQVCVAWSSSCGAGYVKVGNGSTTSDIICQVVITTTTATTSTTTATTVSTVSTLSTTTTMGNGTTAGSSSSVAGGTTLAASSSGGTTLPLGLGVFTTSSGEGLSAIGVYAIVGGVGGFVLLLLGWIWLKHVRRRGRNARLHELHAKAAALPVAKVATMVSPLVVVKPVGRVVPVGGVVPPHVAVGKGRAPVMVRKM